MKFWQPYTYIPVDEPGLALPGDMGNFLLPIAIGGVLIYFLSKKK
jgi:hypothetical protein